MTRFLGVIVSCVAILALRAPAQQVFASESKSWSFTMPAGWTPVSFDAIHQFDNAIHARANVQGFKYIAGFARGERAVLKAPFVLVQISDNVFAGSSYDDIDRIIGSKAFTNARDRTAAQFVSGLSGTTTLDRSRNRLVTRMTFDAGGQRLACSSFAYLGSEKIIQFNCYDLESHGGAQAAEFERFVGSFAFAPGHDFVANASSASEMAVAERAGRLVGGLIGSAVALAVVGVVVKVFRRG